jgi:hypothetical protein
VGPHRRPESCRLVQQVSGRGSRHLERRGILVRDTASSQLTLESGESDDALTEFQAHSISTALRWVHNAVIRR